MIRITIEQVITENYVETKNFITSSTPTTVVQPQGPYDREDKVLCKEEFAVKDVQMQREITRKLLMQEIVKDEDFSLSAVIAAINQLAVVDMAAGKAALDAALRNATGAENI
jgi:hypothetical protein